jgi:hypothetical protein
MQMKSLGELKAVDLRTFWPGEASDFTPWLAQHENLKQLGAALGLIDLEPVQSEVSVGPFSADILAIEGSTGAYVVIENQLGRTDHDHLGKALTYSSALGAKTIVWVAATFTDEHRKALDWLNQNTTEDLAFFGVQVELWSIGDSLPAVRFNVVSRPSETLKQAVSQAHSDLTPAKRLQLEWWVAFRDALLNAKILASAQSPRPQYWYNIALGRAGIHLSAIANVEENRLGVRLYMQNRYGAAAALAQLETQKQAIEGEVGEPLLWNPNPDAIDKIVLLQRQADLHQRDQWPGYLKWLVDAVARMRKAFALRVKALQLEKSEESLEGETDGLGD